MKGTMEVRTNLYILCFAFLCNQSTYVTLENIQSTLNESKGTAALAVLYACFFISSLFLPPYAIRRFGHKRCLVGSMSSYSLYIAANFYPSNYTLIPAAAILGTLSAVMWATVISYVTRLAEIECVNGNLTLKKTTGLFFGTFYSFVNFSLLCGSSIMAVMIAATSSETKADGGFTFDNSSQFYNVYDNTSFHSNQTCGRYYKGYESTIKEEGTQLSKNIKFLLLSAFVILNTIGIVLCACLSDFSNGKIKENEQGNRNDFDASVAKEPSGPLFCIVSKTELIDNGDKTETMVINEDQNSMPTNKFKTSSRLLDIKATLRFVRKDVVVFLMIPHTLHLGALQAFVRASFNGIWVVCNLGVGWVSYTMIILSLSMMLTSLASGKLLHKISQRMLLGSVTLLEVGCLITLLVWSAGESKWPYFLLSIGLGCSHAMFKTQTPTCYARFFPEHQTEAASWQIGVESIGVCIAYAITSVCLPIHVLITTLILLTLGYTLYCTALFIKKTDSRNDNQHS